MRLPHEHLIKQRMKAPLMRSLNGIELLNLIAEHGPVSRASLAKLSRLSKPTVSSQVETLVEQGLVVELGQGESGAKGGKKPTLIRFNADAGRLFAVEIDAEEIRIAAADLMGHVLLRRSVPTGADRSGSAVLGKITRELSRVVDEAGSAPAAHRVVSVASPGRVDVRRGITLEAGNVFHWNAVPIREHLEGALGLPVLVDNNVKMATLGELHFGAAKGMTDVIVVRLDTGIGSGVVVRGRLYHGRNWAAGEIAHMILDLGRATEDWNVRGYLESVVASDRILLQAGGNASAEEFLERAKGTPGPPRQAYDNVVLHAGIAIANLVCAYDPVLIVLQGRMFAVLLDDIRRVIARAVPWKTRVVQSEISGDAVLLGTLAAARSLAYERIASLFDGQGRRDGAPERKGAGAMSIA